MLNAQGVASYCQECGACSGNGSCAAGSAGSWEDRIVDMIVREVRGNLPVNSDSPYPMIPIGVSNRHLHLTEETFKRLFGRDAQIESFRELYQAGEFASKQIVTIAGPKMRSIERVRILGPLRKYDQLEISLTDAISLGVSPPIRNSGDLNGAAPVTLIGPKGSVYLESGAIIANRHMHMSNADAAQFGIRDQEFCKVRIGGEKGAVYENVLVRTNDNWKLQLHLDTDDANAANIRCAMHAEFAGKM